MMKYLCLICIDDKKLQALSGAQMDALIEDSIDFDAALTRRGRYLVGAALKPVDTASTLRLSNGKAVVTDGPFAETREHVGGIVLIEADNLDEAIDIASGIPALRLGSVEIRATRDLRRALDPLPVHSTNPQEHPTTPRRPS